MRPQDAEKKSNLNFYCSTLSVAAEMFSVVIVFLIARLARWRKEESGLLCWHWNLLCEASKISENSLRSFTRHSRREKKRTATSSSHLRSRWEKSLNIPHYDLHFLVGDTALDAQSWFFAPGKISKSFVIFFFSSLVIFRSFLCNLFRVNKYFISVHRPDNV